MSSKEKTLFLAHCIAGLQDFAAEQLIQDFADTDIQHKEEGLIVFSAASVDHSRLSYMNNVFQVLQSFKNKDMNGLLTSCTQEKQWHTAARQSIPKNEETFRLFLSNESQLVSAEREPLNKLIKQIEQQCDITHTSHRPDSEFWLFRRKGDHAYFCKRLTKNRVTEKDLNPGELRPELAQMMCLMSDPVPSDIFLDPFAGSGAIAAARRKWPYEIMFVSDISPEKVQRIKKNTSSKGKPVIVRTADARNLEKINAGFIDKVVTDPPWGLFDKDIRDVPDFYREILHELCRVVKPGGMIVMLIGQREMIAELSREFSKQLVLERSFDILVSGKKASLIKWKRSHAPQ